MLERFKAKLTADCEHVWRLWSTWLAGLAGTVITVLWNDPTVLKDAVDLVPEQYRPWLSPIVFGLATALPVIVRLWPQPGLKRDKP